MGKAISKINGKKEEQPMLQIDDGCTMFHKGEPREKIAYIHMKAFKKASFDDNRALLRLLLTSFTTFWTYQKKISI